MSNGVQSENGLVEAALWIIRIAGALLVLCTLLPFIRTGWWVVRVCDFPRLQLTILCLMAILMMICLVWRRGWSAEPIVMITVLSSVFAWQAWHIAKYTSMWPTTVSSSDTAHLRIIVVNLDYQNTQYKDVRDTIAALDADLILLIEIDEHWERNLADIRKTHSHSTGVTYGHGLGIALWSKSPLKDTHIEYIVSEKRPSVYATIRASETTVRFIGVHPTPPGLARRESVGRHDSRIRDAELVSIARDIAAEPDSAWVVAGDFNDVAWSHTTRLFQRLSGLNDPRVGRGMYSTYHAEYPLLRYPLDHVFLSTGMRVSHLGRVKVPGSDHFAIVADINLAGAGAGVEPTANEGDRQEASGIIDEGLNDASEFGGIEP